MAEDLSKRRKVGGVYRSGTYAKQKAAGKKVANLSKKQVAGGKRVGSAGKASISRAEARTARKSTIDISDTSWKKASERTGPKAKGGIVVGKDGKPVTGSVKLASGKVATYVRGKRVVAGGPKGGGGGGGGGTAKPKGTDIKTTRVTPSQRGEGGPTKPRRSMDGSEGPKRSIPRKKPTPGRSGGGKGYGMAAVGIGSLPGRSNSYSERIAKRLRGGRAAR